MAVRRKKKRRSGVKGLLNNRELKNSLQDRDRVLCTGKPAYKKVEAAVVAKAQGKSIGKKLRPYRCPFCERWHLTSQPRHGKG